MDKNNDGKRNNKGSNNGNSDSKKVRRTHTRRGRWEAARSRAAFHRRFSSGFINLCLTLGTTRRRSDAMFTASRDMSNVPSTSGQQQQHNSHSEDHDFQNMEFQDEDQTAKNEDQDKNQEKTE